MDALQIETDVSDLRQPYLLLTFSGWSDAAGVATAAGRFLVEHLEAERIAQIDPEDFYSFADQRPQAQYNEGGRARNHLAGKRVFSQPPTATRARCVDRGRR